MSIAEEVKMLRLEGLVAELTRRVDRLEANERKMIAVPPFEVKRGPGRPPKDAA